MNAKDLEGTDWFRDLTERVSAELQRMREARDDRKPGLAAEVAGIDDRIRGLRQSLGNPNLSPDVRAMVEEDLQAAIASKRQIEDLLTREEADRRLADTLLDPQRIADRLDRLAECLAADNPSLTNIELALHIDSIACDADGRVVLRTCRLGVLGEGLDELRGAEPPPATEAESSSAPDRVRPRRLAVRRTAGEEDGGRDLGSLAHWACDPHRFAGLPEGWFDEYEFRVPEKLSWAEEHAREIAEYRLTKNASMEATAAHFGVSIPTIRAALEYARDLHGLDAFGKVVSRPTLPNWSRQNAAAVAAFVHELKQTMHGKMAVLRAAVAHFGKSEPTIRKALAFAAEAEATGSDASEDTDNATGHGDDASAA